MYYCWKNGNITLMENLYVKRARPMRVFLEQDTMTIKGLGYLKEKGNGTINKNMYDIPLNYWMYMAMWLNSIIEINQRNTIQRKRYGLQKTHMCQKKLLNTRMTLTETGQEWITGEMAEIQTSL